MSARSLPIPDCWLARSVVASPAGAIFFGALELQLSDEGCVSTTTVGIDGAEVLPAPAGEYIGIKIDLEEIGLGPSSEFCAAQQCSAIVGKAGRHPIIADRDEPRIIGLIRPKNGDMLNWHGVILSLAGGGSCRVTDAGAESIRLGKGRISMGRIGGAA